MQWLYVCFHLWRHKLNKWWLVYRNSLYQNIRIFNSSPFNLYITHICEVSLIILHNVYILRAFSENPLESTGAKMHDPWGNKKTIPSDGGCSCGCTDEQANMCKRLIFSSPEPKAHNVSLWYTNGPSSVCRRPHFQTWISLEPVSQS